MKNRIPFRAAALSMACAVAMTTFLVTDAPSASAAEPGAVPSQISLAIGQSESSDTVSMNLNWVTDTSVTSSEVVYGQDPALADGVAVQAAESELVSSDVVSDSGQDDVKPIHSFKAEISGLTPGATYYYKTGSAQTGYSEIASFVAPDASSEKDPFSFLVCADTQGKTPEAYDNTRELYSYLAENESDSEFLIHTGDIVNNANYSDQWQYFFDAAESLMTTMPVMTAPGNHDSNKYDRNLAQYRARFNYTNLTAPEGLSEAAQGTIYSFEYGDVLFICLNNFVTDADKDIEWQFLADQCANTDRAWKVVYYHNATYDPGTSHYKIDNESGLKLTQAGVDLVLNGHEHAYARSTIETLSAESGTDSIRAHAEPGEAPTYVIGGVVAENAAGLNQENDTSWNDFFYDLRIDPSATGRSQVYSPGVYAKVDVTSNELVYTAYYKADGSEDFQVIDTFTITKTGDEITQPSGGGVEPRCVTYLWDSFEQEDGQYIARFNWITDTDTTGTELFYAKKSDFDANGGKFTNVVCGDETVVDLSEEIEAMNLPDGTTNYAGEDGARFCYAPVCSHKAETAVLEPDTEYVYCVGDGSANTTSVTDPQVIKTPAADTDSFTFLFVTDAQRGPDGSFEATRSDYNDFHDLLTRATTAYPDAAFVLSGGDNVNWGIDTWQWDAFYDAGKETFARYPFYLVGGNHECYKASGFDIPVDQSNREVLAHCNIPHNGAGYYGGGDGTQPLTTGLAQLQAKSGNYYFIYGDTLFLVLDFQDYHAEGFPEAEAEWIQSVVKQNPTKWRVAVMHRSMFGQRITDPTTGWPRAWTDTFDEAGIDLVMMGHDHLYVRTKYYTDGGVADPQTPGSGTTYITGASANTDNRSERFKDNPYALVHSTTDYGRAYVAVSISPDEIRVTTRGLQTIDGSLQEVTLEDNALVTDTPRTYDLSSYTYPAVPEEKDDFTITGAEITGTPVAGLTLEAVPTPNYANTSFQWEKSTDGTTWTAIEGAINHTYEVQPEDVNCSLRCTVTGVGLYSGTATSEPVSIIGSQFTDVPDSAYYYTPVYWALDQGIVAGTTETTFSPASVCTRAQLVTFLWRAAGEPTADVTVSFTDVPSNSYYYKAVQWAYAEGITSGTTRTTFSPSAPCTRAQAVTFLWNYSDRPDVTSAEMPFTDVKDGAYYENAVLWASQEGVVKGETETQFGPNHSCTRAQAVCFLYRLMNT